MKRWNYFTRTALKYFAVALVITGAFLLPYILTFHDGLSSDHLAWGSFGSYLGSILGPLFSGFAFITLLYTIYWQRQQLRHSILRERKEDELDDLYRALETMAAKLDKLRENVEWKVLLTSIDRNQTPVASVQRHFNWNEMKTVIEHMASALSRLELVSRGSQIGAFYRGVYRGFVEKLFNMQALKEETYKIFASET